MFFYKEFTFPRNSDVSNALDSLRADGTAKLLGKIQTSHLHHIIEASRNSTSKLGSLDGSDLARLKWLGSCTHTELLILLLEPTKESNATIVWIDSFLRSATGGVFTAENTAIFNCRALTPNASYNRRYEDKHALVLIEISSQPASDYFYRTGQYGLRAVTRSIKELAPDVILVCQCNMDPGVATLIPHLTRPMSEAGKARLVKINGKDCSVVNAFHPSVFAKNITSGSLAGGKAVMKAALLEFCFLQAVNLALGTEIVGSGIEGLRRIALQSFALGD
ncbi:hypothetical protein M409DRAFT_61410 [Zasmidium cellare ATCC 36951]|uniref:Uncharacterized protein n=1 Tax=Zasmidium cellare ATCC 36951 TaxID=1080233 RepID=A0A6A6BYT9_ZASCE|nr:uncharacterized protein M409DRAFT_61410 [Zasmidium cellare ATCC 36951]KAF2158752.1 hypothetical protein M409DRAFT_61410 [Zasmidium cellare ATCC 36951]